MESIYVLQCFDGKYYIGSSNNVISRYTQHTSGEGSEWTKKYKPINLIESSLKTSEYDENNTVKKYMKKYGINNVRGGIYASINLSKNIIDLLEKEFLNDLCYKCGSKGHFAKEYDYKEFITYNKLYCTRCLRNSHNIDKCYARSDITGKLLDKVYVIKNIEDIRECPPILTENINYSNIEVQNDIDKDIEIDRDYVPNNKTLPNNINLIILDTLLFAKNSVKSVLGKNLYKKLGSVFK